MMAFVSFQRRSIGRRLLDRIFGFDFFISYSWKDGGTYARNLAHALEKEGFEVFLDREDYSSGDSWKEVGRWTLWRTAQLVLVATPEALDSKPVEREVRLFQKSKRRIVPIEFNGSLGLGSTTRVGKLLKSDVLRLSEPCCADTPADVTIEEIRKTFTLTRQDRKRSRILLIVAATMMVLAAIGASMAVIAENARTKAEESATRALAQAFSSAAYSLAERDPTFALRLSQHALTLNNNTTAYIALLKAFNSGSWLYSQRIDAAIDGDFAGDGKSFAWTDGKKITLRTLDGASVGEWPAQADHVLFDENGNLVSWSPWEGPGSEGRVDIWGKDPSLKGQFRGPLISAERCGSSRIAFLTFQQGKGDEREVALHRMNTTDSQSTFVSLPGFVDGLRASIGCSADGNIVALAGPLSRTLYVVKEGQTEATSHAWQGSGRPTDVLVEPSGQFALIYLVSDREGANDAIAVVPLKGDAPASRIDLGRSAVGDEPGGLLLSLGRNRILAASTGGWTVVVDLTDEKPAVLEKAGRAADRLAGSVYTGEFVIGQRSGLATIYNASGFQIGRLLGSSSSDGLNPSFSRLVVSPDGQTILTITRDDGLRLWSRPEYPLLIARASNAELIDDKLPANLAARLSVLGGPTQTLKAKQCEGTRSIVIDGYGEMKLCFEFGGRTELMSPGLTDADIELIASSSEPGDIAAWYGARATQMFVMSPTRILDWLNATKIQPWSPTIGEMEELVQ
ncbi:toll/interleukin-1 receptor domain-containing protein [Rhizobium sp. RHZ01]|nr:toll/interleukin-1 receptor domain-containing protein [Rhizobium sp. RHZ01]